MTHSQTRKQYVQAASTHLSSEELIAVNWRAGWLKRAHEHQKVTEDWWTAFLILGGRGSGKTRCAAEETGWRAYRNPGTRWLVSAPTSSDLRDVCIEGDSGLMSVIPHQLVRDYNRSLHEIIIKTGAEDSIIKGIPASEPERFRGPQFHGGWLDELAAWQYDRDAYDMIMFGMRLGQKPQLIVTTTPKPRALIRDLVKREGKDVKIVRASTYANLANLAPTFRDQILRYENTTLGRQEIHAELLDPEEQGIIKRTQIRLWPAKKALPQFDYIVMSLDTAFTEETRDKETGDPDPTACQVWGLFTWEHRPNAMMLDAWQERLGFPDLIKRVSNELKAEYGQSEQPIIKPMFGPSRVNQLSKKIDLLLIEDKGSGISLRQTLAREGIHAYAYNPGRAKKLERLHMVSHLFPAGVVWMVESELHEGRPRTWAEPVVEQLTTFAGDGTIPHDDHIDAATQALRVLSDRNMLQATRPAPREEEPERLPVTNPYDV